MFLVLGLPRCRTTWLASFLSYGDWFCGHDELRRMRSFEDTKSWCAQPLTGTVETNAASWWRLIPDLCPDAKIVVVRRPVDEVVESLIRVGVKADRAALTKVIRHLDRKLVQIERRLPGVLSVTFADLASEEACARVFEHCLPHRHDPAWWAHLSPMNIQISMPALIRYAVAHQKQLEKLGAQATQRVRSKLMARPVPDASGMTFQAEPFDVVYADAEHLFRDHLVQTDQHPEAFRTKNAPLMRKLEKAGCLQVMTARCNGRIFGYLMSVIAPSLDDADELAALQTTFYAAPEFPGLGMKMERASVTLLEQCGVTEVDFRAGVRGDGPRMGAIYRRLGAHENGQLFRLKLNGE